MEKIYSIKDMSCNSCAQIIERALKDKVNKIYVSFIEEEAIIDFDKDKISEKEILEIINKLGYEAKPAKIDNSEDKIDKIAQNIKELKAETKKVEALEEEIAGREEEIEEKEEEIEEEIKKTGQKKEGFTESIESMHGFEKFLFWVIVGVIILVLFVLIYRSTGFSFSNFNLPDIQIPELGQRTSLILLFLAGILTGFHCVSMCGGFVVSYTAKNAINGYKGFKQHLVYGGSKVMSYAIIGGIFGLIGGVFAFSIKLRGTIAILAGIFMIFYALSMFGFKFFRRFQFNPKFLTKAAANANDKARGPFKAPFITGLLNGLFLACGPLQAMYLYAMGTGNFFTGAASLAVFGLGTLPVMLGFGFLATTISHKTTGRILKVSAIIVLILGLIMLNRGLSLTGSNFTFDNIKASLTGGNAAIIANSIGSADSGVNIINGIQEVNMQVSGSGYSPNSFVLKKGIPVKWNVDVTQLTGCNSELVVAAYNIDKNLKQGLNVIEFTPDKVGTISFTCGMGMLRGSFIVTETGTASQSEVQAATPAKGMQCGGSGGGGCGCGG